MVVLHHWEVPQANLAGNRGQGGSSLGLDCIDGQEAYIANPCTVPVLELVQ